MDWEITHPIMNIQEHAASMLHENEEQKHMI